MGLASRVGSGYEKARLKPDPLPFLLELDIGDVPSVVASGIADVSVDSIVGFELSATTLTL